MIAEPDRLEILWEDSHGLAVNKPAGLLTQPARVGDPEVTLESMVRHHLRPDDPASVYLGTVHRLDRPVSGVVLWAKNPKAAHRWSDQFAQRQTQKIYWAIVEDQAQQARGLTTTWTDWLTAPDQSGQARAIPAAIRGAVRAETRVEWQSEVQLDPSWHGFACLTLYPATGRTHQLRVQTSSRGWPIVGDRTYGSKSTFPGGIALHARSLRVEHPVRHDPLVIEAALPGSWGRWLAGMD